MPNEGEKESSTSESSLESSSGYGSQTTFNVEDVVQTADGMYIKLAYKIIGA